MSPIRVILHPTDFSADSAEASRLALSLARDRGARLIVLHVEPREIVDGRFIAGPVPDSYREELWQRLRHFGEGEHGVRVEPMLRRGDAPTEILRAAEESGCDLIVMGTRGRSGLGRALMGSVAEDVLRGAECPVLTAKGREAGPDEVGPGHPARRPERPATPEEPRR